MSLKQQAIQAYNNFQEEVAERTARESELAKKQLENQQNKYLLRIINTIDDKLRYFGLVNHYGSVNNKNIFRETAPGYVFIVIDDMYFHTQPGKYATTPKHDFFNVLKESNYELGEQYDKQAWLLYVSPGPYSLAADRIDNKVILGQWLSAGN